MAGQTLAVKYRPRKWDDVCEQTEVKSILNNQLKTDGIRHAYLFVGPAGTGKTTCARIFANEINGGQGNPIELDAASHNGVDDVREIISQAKTKSVDSEYKIFIVDECHGISSAGWQAFLKLLEEPPAKSVFIFCTTEAQKIPRTILSRVQRYDFRKISQDGIERRLFEILNAEGVADAEADAVKYVAKRAEGGCRDAITTMEKCLAFGQLTLENVVAVLGDADYSTMFRLTDAILDMDAKEAVGIIEKMHGEGKDLRQFVRAYCYFLLDVEKHGCGCPFEYLQIPELPECVEWLGRCEKNELAFCKTLLGRMLELNANIRYSQWPKADVEAVVLLLCLEE